MIFLALLIAFPQVTVLEQKVLPTVPRPGLHFGSGAGLAGNRALISGDVAGDVDLYSLQRGIDGAWSSSLFPPPEPMTFTRFGFAVAMDDDLAAISAFNPTTTAGRIYLFRLDLQPPALIATIDPPNLGILALDGDTLAVGAGRADVGANDSGAVFVFRNVGGLWGLETTITPSTPATGLQFSNSLSLAGQTLAVGSGLGTESISIYSRSVTGWTQETTLMPSDSVLGDDFGWACSVDGNTIAVGAPMVGPGATTTGAIYVFVRGPGGWIQDAKLEASDPVGNERLGLNVVIRGNRVYGGARSHDNGFESGAVYVFERQDAGWEQIHKLIPGDNQGGDNFSQRVEVCGDTLLATAIRSDEAGADAGAAYFYRLLDLPSAPGTAFCYGANCPCGNDSPSSGCLNSTGSGSTLMGSGTRSVTAADLILTALGAPPSNSGLFFFGNDIFLPFQVGDGLVCTGGTFRFLPSTVGPNGAFVLSSPVTGAPAGSIVAGVTRHFQSWTRDVLCGPPPTPCPSSCGNNSNLSNGYSVTFTP